MRLVLHRRVVPTAMLVTVASGRCWEAVLSIIKGLAYTMGQGEPLFLGKSCWSRPGGRFCFFRLFTLHFVMRIQL